jgi:NADPH:quinone reductase-like Zn-dependent oxidoreductase
MISTMMSTATPGTPATTLIGPAEVLLVHAGSPPPMDWLQSLQVALGGKDSSITSLEALQGVSDLKGKICVFLGEMDRSLLESVVSDDFTSLASMLQHSQCTLWVTRGAAMASDDPWKALHLGLLRTLRNENHSRRFVSLDLDPLRDPWTAQSCDAIVNVLNAVDASHEKEFEYAEHDGIIHVPRTFSDLSPSDKEDLVVLEPFQNETRLVRLDVQTPGLLDSLHFKLCSADEAWSSELPEDWVEIEPRAFGLNFRDIMSAMGQLETNRVMGFECAGVVTRLGKAARTGAGGLAIGDRVCALMKGHWASRVRTARTNVVRIPVTLSFEQAASIPLAFTTAYISLYTRLQRGEKVLIHGGAGGVGQAAIILAQLVGAEVFTTAGTHSKRSFLMDKFKLASDHVFSSRDSGFVEGIKVCTNGKGVDVVVNSLAGPLLQNSFDCLANFGRFVEIGKKDIEQNSRLGMSTFARNVSFSSIDILYWEEAKSAEVLQSIDGDYAALGTKDNRFGWADIRIPHVGY